MKTRRLGKTGLVVSEICLGTMTFGSIADEKESHAILDRADAAGVDFLDVAELYPVPPDPKWAGRSEEIVGSWLEERRSRDTLFIATKVAGPGGGWFRAAVRGGRTALDRHHIARGRRQPAPARHRLHRPVPDALARPGPALRRGHGGARPRGAGGQGPLRRLQQRDRLRPDQEPGRLGRARARALRDDPEQLHAAQPPLRGRARERVPAREGEPAAVQPDRRRRADRQVPGRRVARGRALHALPQDDQRGADHDAALRQREDARRRPSASRRSPPRRGSRR